MAKAMTRALHLTAVLILLLANVSARADDTAVLNVTQLGHEKLQRLRDDVRVLWHIEAGNELLIAGKNQASLDAIANYFDTPIRRSLGNLKRDEVYFREHACLEDRKLPSVGVLGGYELMRAPASLVKTNLLYNERLIPAPINGALSRALDNAPKSDMRESAPRSALVQGIVDRVSIPRWQANVQALSSFNRNTFNNDIENAHSWIINRFQALGLTTQSFAFDLEADACPGVPALTRHNPIGIKTGARFPNEWIVIGAHYDSRNNILCEASGVQPGANDNASGCAGVVELAEAFQNTTPERTLVFVCFSGEEQGLLGSQRYVSALQSNGDINKVKLMINLDMIGHDPNFIQEARIETVINEQRLYPMFASAARRYAPELSLIQASTTFAYSDHWPFLGAGVPAIFTWENGAGIYPQYHTSADLLSNMTNAGNLARGIMRMDAAVIAEQAIELRFFADGFD